VMGLVRDRARWNDAQLLAAVARCDDRAFSAFYRRHLGMVVSWCACRTDPEVAADLTAEVFAAVLIASPLAVEDYDLARILDLADDRAGSVRGLLEALPVDERVAVHARVIDEREYGDIAQSLGCSELVIRKRVSRGLARLRARLAS